MVNNSSVQLGKYPFLNVRLDLLSRTLSPGENLHDFVGSFLPYSLLDTVVWIAHVTSVETILKKRKKERRVQYLIKWHEYPESFNSWIFKQNLQKRGVALWSVSLANGTEWHGQCVILSEPSTRLRYYWRYTNWGYCISANPSFHASSRSIIFGNFFV
jgi:hypothetical protein